MTPGQAANKLADALAEMARAETKLHRALTRWSVARRNVKRLERQLEKAANPPGPGACIHGRPLTSDDADGACPECLHDVRTIIEAPLEPRGRP